MDQMELGYRFEPPCAHDEPCHRRLTVLLQEPPTRQHYDPHAVHCQVVKAGSGRETLEVEHPWLFTPRYRLYPGRIIVNDHVGKKVEAFSFGGELTIEAVAEYTVCRFDSPAPLLPLPAKETTLGVFAAEVEAVLAERQAHWEMAGSLWELEKRLAEIDPFALYVVCLGAVESKLQAMGYALNGAARDALHLVRRQREMLEEKGRWPKPVTAIDEAL